MLNILYFTREQKGFILPFVLFTVAIIMLLTTSGIHIYQNNIRLTHQHIQQLKIETIFQSGLALFKQDLQENDIPPSKSPRDKLTKLYSLPDGEVEFQYRMAEEEELANTDKPAYFLDGEITIAELSYSVYHYVSLPHPDDE